MQKIEINLNKGITLIALVITIIILLILAGIAISTLTGENGVLSKAKKAKEEHLIEQYREEINLIILEEITERKTETKEELMIISLDTKIRKKDWVNEIYKCNGQGEEQPTFEESTHLLVESKEHYEYLIEVNEENGTAKIVSVQKGTGETYQITYHPNGGEGQEETIEVRQGFSITLKECEYTKDQYKFVGWSKTPEGEGERYLGNSKYQPEGSETLYAIWESTTVTITFNSNDGTSKIEQTVVAKEKDTKLPNNTFERNGYRFVEWCINSNGSGTKYQEGQTINITENLNLYAIWEKIYKADGSWNEEAKVNTPKLKGDMQAVYWDNNGNEVSNDIRENWYEYVAGNNQTDTKTSKWANAKTADGSYWVWIPRYEYKILSGEGTSNTGKIEVKFIPTTQTTADSGYKIHPAFQNGTTNKFKRGEWDSELAGIWVAKFEMSMEKNGVATTTSSEAIGNVLTNSNIKMVSKPNVSSWRYITIGNSYTNCYNYDRNKESHLMKNSEWGAVVYLAHSQMGRNGYEITINNNSNFVTGIAGDTVSASETTATTNHYKTTKRTISK